MLEIDYELKDILISALRYALGRKTYIVNETCGYIKKHSELLDDRVKSVMLKDIYNTLDDDKKGLYKLDDCDKAEIITLQIFLENYEVGDDK